MLRRLRRNARSADDDSAWLDSQVDMRTIDSGEVDTNPHRRLAAKSIDRRLPFLRQEVRRSARPVIW